MSHEITKTDSALFAREAAWHGLGIVVSEAPTPLRAMEMAGLNWTVRKSDGIVADGIETQDYCAVVREDTNTVLAVHTSQYEPVQNIEVVDIAQSTGLKTESMLSIAGGRKLIVLLRGETFAPKSSPNDEVAEYLALLNSHDGSLALSAMPTSVRIVCANTLKMAIAADAAKSFRVTHKGDMEEKRRTVANAVQRFVKSGQLFAEQVEQMSRRNMTAAEVQEFWLGVYGKLHAPVVANPKTQDEQDNRENAQAEIATWSQRFDDERSHLKAPPSVWMAANAVTHSIQHRVGGRGRRRTMESKAYGNLVGLAQERTMMVMREAAALV